MPSEEAEIHEYLRLQFHLASGFILPDGLCHSCARQLFSLFAGQPLDELLAEPHHQCPYQLTPLTVLHAALHGDPELVDIIGEDIGVNGWGLQNLSHLEIWTEGPGEDGEIVH